MVEQSTTTASEKQSDSDKSQMLNSTGRPRGILNRRDSQEPQTYGTQVVYALVLEHLKRATNMTVQNADTERAINKKANLNYRVQKQIEDSKQEQHSHDNDIKVQDSKQKELSVEMNRLKDAQCYLNLTLFTDADLDKCNEIVDSAGAGASGASRTG